MRGGEEEGRRGENLREGEQLIGEETREEEREEGRLATESVDPKFTEKSIWMKFEPFYMTIYDIDQFDDINRYTKQTMMKGGCEECYKEFSSCLAPGRSPALVEKLQNT